MGVFGQILPPIMVGEGDQHDLLVLAMGGAGHSRDQVDNLLRELGRAEIVDDEALPSDLVKMGSTATALINGGKPQYLRLSYPHERAHNGLSVLSPRGTALLGLRAGQSMNWTDREGKRHEVHVFSVSDRDAEVRAGSRQVLKSLA